MAARQRGGGSLRRRAPRTDERKRYVVFCEGRVTEPGYLVALERYHRVTRNFVFDIHEGVGPPRTLVERAKQAKTEAGTVAADTEYWCVFDVEAPEPHPGLQDAVVMARDNGIRVAVSNPCFELWLILHYADRTAWLTTATAESLRSQYDGSTGKGINGEDYVQHRMDAVGRAKNLKSRHEGDMTRFPDDNPSSGMFKLVEAVEPPSDN